MEIMKTLILFSSKYDTTRDCAVELKNYLSGQVDLVNVKNMKKLSPENYDRIIIGAPVYKGIIDKGIRAFTENNRDSLKNKDYGLFMCCMSQGARVEEQFNNNFSKEILNGAKVKENFGGKFKFSRMSFIEKKMIIMISKKEPSLGVVDGKRDIDKVNHQNIIKFAKAICGESR